MEFNNSRQQDFLTCEMKYKHRWINQAVTTKSAHFFVLGSAIHRFIEMLYRTADTQLAKQQVVKVFGDVDRGPLNREEIHELECDLQMALGIAEAYPRFYKSDFDTYQKFLTEQKFRVKLPNGHFFFGTIDALLQDAAGDWWLLETKTASPQSLGDDYFERVKIDSQVAGYMHGAKEILGSFPRGVIYNVIKKTSIRLKAGESLPAFQQRQFLEYTQNAAIKNYFTRVELEVARHRLETWIPHQVYLTDRMAGKHANGKDEPWIKNTGACRANYGTCPYMVACIEGKYNRLLYKKDETPK